MTTMTVVYRKVRTFWPVGNVLASGWFRHVQNDGHSILIIIPLDSLMRVGWVGCNQAMHFLGEFGCFKILQRVFLSHVLVLNGQHCHILSVCGRSIWFGKFLIRSPSTWHYVWGLSLISCCCPGDRVEWIRVIIYSGPISDCGRLGLVPSFIFGFHLLRNVGRPIEFFLYHLAV